MTGGVTSRTPNGTFTPRPNPQILSASAAAAAVDLNSVTSWPAVFTPSPLSFKDMPKVKGSWRAGLEPNACSGVELVCRVDKEDIRHPELHSHVQMKS